MWENLLHIKGKKEPILTYFCPKVTEQSKVGRWNRERWNKIYNHERWVEKLFRRNRPLTQYAKANGFGCFMVKEL